MIRRTVAGGCIAALAISGTAMAAPETKAVADAWTAGAWTVGVSGGWLNFEGDEPVEDAFIGSLQVGRDLSERWTLEAVLDLAPDLDENMRRDWRTGQPVSRLEEEAGDGVHDTSSVRLSLDALYHLSRWDRFDPYLAAGVGVIRYEDDVGNDLEPCLRAGFGAMVHLTGAWALRTDARWLCAGGDTEQNLILTAGVVWGSEPEGAEVEPPPAAAPADAGKAAGTAPDEADTDRDGLTDREETQTHKTDPRNPDSDYDGLTDGEEVRRHQTDPLKRDTDGGGVADGHEVIEDGTQPRQKADDLEFYELQMTFANDGWEIKAEYVSDLDAIAKILKGDDGSRARIESHVDGKAGSVDKEERQRTQRRADAILTHFVEKCGIDRKRLEGVGYGFSRPKAANEAQAGNPVNRRVEIYVRRTPGAR